MSFRRVLIAVAESPSSALAARVGLELARSLGAEVAFVHAVDPVQGYAPQTGMAPADLMTLARQDGQKLLSEFARRAALEPPPLEFLCVGKPGVEIAKAARDWSADVIVLGSHGRGGLTRLLVGSVAEAVMRHAPCSVLVARAER